MLTKLNIMKKIILTLTLLFSISIFSQDEIESKFYLGIGVGVATVDGDVNINGDYKTGIHINFLNTGYRFNDTWGITLNLGSAGHAIDNSDSALGIGALSLGPIMSFPISNIKWDFKPQYAFSMAGVVRGGDAESLGLEDLEIRGSGFVLANSFIMSESKGFTWTIDVDYLMGKFDEYTFDGVDYEQNDETYNSLRFGFGLRYNF
jgi:hypothetical protein